MTLLPVCYREKEKRMEDVGEWLDNIGLGQYRATFAANNIDSEALTDLTEQDLARLGCAFEHRSKLLKEIRAFRSNRERAAVDGQKSETPDDQSPGGPERRQLTVLFCDLVGSTELSARLDPEDYRAVMVPFLGSAADVVRSFGGYVARYMGDGVLVYFGWPTTSEDAVERAVRAALAIVNSVSASSFSGEKLQARIGIATGLVVVGDLIGAGAAQERAVIGDTPNLAARLQALAAPNTVVISQSTRELLGRLFDLEQLDLVQVKGLPDPVQAWRVIGEVHTESRFTALRAGGRSKMIDRVADLEFLSECWRNASRGRGQAVILVGEAGIGKSRIAAELDNRIGSAPRHLSRYQCSPLHTSSALYPVVRELEFTARIENSDPPERRLEKLTDVLKKSESAGGEGLALLASLLSIPIEGTSALDGLDPQRRKARTFLILIERFLSLARQAPLLLLLEDAQWIDPTTRELFDAVIARISKVPILFIVTTRPDAQPIAQRGPNTTIHVLNRLNQADSTELARQGADRSLPPTILDQIVSKTDGNPFFIEEFTRALLQEGAVDESPDATSAARPARSLAVPATLHDSLMARLDHLGRAKELAQTCAVLGREFTHEMVEAISGLDEIRLHGHLQQMMNADLIIREGIGDNASYSFTHALLQDAAYASLLQSKRREIHSRAGDILSNNFPRIAEAQPELIARHYEESRRHAEAFDYWRKAARRNLLHSANSEAVMQLRRCLALLPNIGDETQQGEHEFEVRLDLAVALSGTAGFTAPEWGSNSAKLLSLHDRLGKATRSFPVFWGQWVGTFSSGDIAGALALAKRSLEIAQPLNDRVLLMVSHRMMGMSLVARGAMPEARAHLEQAIELYDPEADPPLVYRYAIDQRLSAMCYYFIALLQLGHCDQALALARQAVTDAKRVNNANTTAYVLSLAIYCHGYRRDAEALAAIAKELLALSAEHGFRSRELLAQTVANLLLADSGAEAPLRQVRLGISELQAKNWGFWVPFLLLMEAEIHARYKRVDEIRVLLDEVRLLIEPTSFGLHASEFHRQQGTLLRLEGADNSAVEAEFLKAIEVARGGGMRLSELRAALDLAEFRRDASKLAEARGLLGTIYGSFKEGFAMPDLQRAKTILDTIS